MADTRNKRTKDQVRQDRARITELLLQQHTQMEIRDILEEETGITLSRQQITQDVGVIRKEWQQTAQLNMGYLLMQELERINILEREIWRAMRESIDAKEKKVIEEAAKLLDQARRDGEGNVYDLAISRITTTLEKSGINPSYFAQIQECQKERRRLLGMYAPQKIDVRKEVAVKAYAEVSPGDWPDIIEGELTSGE